MLPQIRNHHLCVLLRCSVDRIECKLRILRCLVGIIDPGKTLDLASSCLGIHALDIARFADRQRRVDKDLDKVAVTKHATDIVAGAAIGADRGANDDTAMACRLRGHKADPAHIGIAIVLAETKSFREVGAHHIAVQDRDLATMLHQECSQDIGCRRFSRAAQTGKPEADTLTMARWIGFRENIRNLRSGKPCRQGLAMVQILLTHLRTGDRGRPGAFLDAVNLFVALFIGQVDECTKGDRLDADLIGIFSDKFLGVIGAIKGFALGIVAGARMVTPDNQMIAAIVAPDNRVPECFARSPHAHGQR